MDPLEFQNSFAYSECAQGIPAETNGGREGENEREDEKEGEREKKRERKEENV